MKYLTVIFTSSLLMMMTCSSAFAASATHPKHHRSHHKLVEQQTSVSPIDLNTADMKTLSSLKGIGLKKAKAIVAYRQQHGNFKSLMDLAQVKGISQKSIARLLKNNPNRLIINR
ncbi:ComEA family DNA-binding protein [Candidiatus Paracoxiella cheracis]|uniref:ComEA family DNA-binding protein n=1 Tax=Candidiatus Paracoxiella cheracis TaxID=3405120 RepID=UPI003BF4644D